MRVDELTQRIALPSERPLRELDAAAIDVELQNRSCADAQLRLRMGELLDALFLTHGHHELGFSSIEAYGVERAGENARWCQESRALARRLRERNLRHLRGALSSGLVSWSMAEVLSRYAEQTTELGLIRRARGQSVRAMQVALAGGDSSRPGGHAIEEPERRTRRRAATREELAMLHTSRLLVSHLSNGAVSDESFLNALLGETESNLAAWREQRERGGLAPIEAAEDERAIAWRALAELHEKLAQSRQDQPTQIDAGSSSGSSVTSGAGDVSVGSDPRPIDVIRLTSDPGLLDEAITRLAAERAGRAVELAALALRFLDRRLWRRLGFATLTAYVEARPGVCLSTLEHLATLGRHLRRYPPLTSALGAGKLGTEAALLIGRVLGRWSDSIHATAWIERACVRTYRCLREEVSLVLAGLAYAPEMSRMPPGLEDLEAAAALERRVQSGELYRSLLGAQMTGPQTSVTLEAPETAGSTSAQPCLPLSLRLSDELYEHFLGIESEFRALAGPEPSFLAFMCTSLWTAWLPYLEAWDDKWASVYRRDRHRCQNPVCGRRDITPHHIVFRAHGGGDEDENMVTLCFWCHLYGVHTGRITVEGRGSALTWIIGRNPILAVRGRLRDVSAVTSSVGGGPCASFPAF